MLFYEIAKLGYFLKKGEEKGFEIGDEIGDEIEDSIYVVRNVMR